MDDKIIYTNDLGMNIIKSVTITYGSGTLARYEYCSNCKRSYEVNINDKEYDDLYKEIMRIPKDAPKDWCSSCLSTLKDKTPRITYSHMKGIGETQTPN